MLITIDARGLADVSGGIEPDVAAARGAAEQWLGANRVAPLEFKRAKPNPKGGFDVYFHASRSMYDVYMDPNNKPLRMWQF
jgi:hypothetical protein